MRTVFTREPLEQLEGLRAGLFPTIKGRLGRALMVADVQHARGVVAVPERERPGTFVHIVFRARRSTEVGRYSIQEQWRRDEVM